MRLEGNGDDMFGLFVRSVVPIRKDHSILDGVVLTFYEMDWYKEENGKNGSTSLGGSGIVVHPTVNGFKIRIKNWQPDGLNVSSVSTTVPVPKGVNMKDFFTIRFVDDGSKVTISVNNETIAIVKMSDMGEYEEVEDDNAYFKTVTVHDEEGIELLALDNAKVSAGASYVAIGNRQATVHLNNFYIAYDVDGLTETPETSESTEAPTATDIIEATEKPNERKSSNILPIVIGVFIVLSGVVLVLVIIKKKK